MDKMKEPKGFVRGHGLYGSMTVSPKGQVVIPANARKELGINSGDTLLLFKTFPGLPGVVLLKAEAVEEILTTMIGHVTEMERQVKHYKSSKSKKEERGLIK